MNNLSQLYRNLKNNTRNANLGKNILLSLIFKGLSIVCSILIIPLSLKGMNGEQYGVWLTISSLVGWIGFFDLGLGNGLRNELAVCFAQKDYRKAKEYVSTAYFTIALVSIAIMVVVFCFFYYVDITKVIHVSPFLEHDFRIVIMFAFISFCVLFVLKLINMIFLANQKAFVSDLINFLGVFISLVAIYILNKCDTNSFISISLAFVFSPLVVVSLFYVAFFNYPLRELIPSVKHINTRVCKLLFGQGMLFFIIQISSLVLFMTSNLIINNLLGSNEVTVYNIAYKYMTVVSMFFSILLTPFWSSFTQAYFNNEFEWIKSIMRILTIVWGVLSLLSLIMVFFSDIVYRIWIGSQVEVPLTLTFSLFLYVSILNIANVYSNFLYGIGHIKKQVYVALFNSIFFIPLAMVGVKLFGLIGIVIVSCFMILISLVSAVRQYNNIMKHHRSIKNHS